MTFLEKFLGSLPKIQARQLRRLLTEKRQAGEIQTLDEYKNALAEKTKELLGTELAPSLRVYFQRPGDLTSHEQFRDFLKSLEDDLGALFSEAKTLAEVILAHEEVIREAILGSMRLTIEELERRVSELRLLGSASEGASKVLSETFRSVFQKTGRSDPSAPLLYTDFVTGLSLNTDRDAAIDLLGEKLTLGVGTKAETKIIETRLIDNSTELEVDFPGSTPNSMIDGTAGTYWLHSILATSRREGGAEISIELDLGGGGEVSYIELEPVALRTMSLTSIQYVNANDAVVSLISTSRLLDEGIVQVIFPKIVAKRLILTLRQAGYIESQFEMDPERQFYGRALAGLETTIPKDSIAESLREIFRSSRILQDGFGIETSSQDGAIVSYYEYNFGFDNIRVGTFRYADEGIFVSKKLAAEPIGIISLVATETRPAGVSIMDTRDTSSFSPGDIYYHGSIEYWIVHKGYSPRGTVVFTDILPVLPAGQTRIYHERLLLTGRSGGSENNIGFPRFYTTEADGSIRIYRDGQLLVEGTAWDFYDTLTVSTPGTGVKMRLAVSITEPVASSIYTISYDPVVSTLRQVPVDPASGYSGTIVDLTGDIGIRVFGDNLVILDDRRQQTVVEASDLFLVILLRRNTYLEHLTPTVEDFSVRVSEKLPARFDP